MIARERYELLCSDGFRRSVEECICRDPLDIALDKRLPCAAEVASQVKYLQRAQHKLPSYFAARCIIPSLAFEQSSSELCALHKPLAGNSVLDLTCGLGVDAFALSKRFRRVVTVERDEVLADVARENFRRLGATNIEVVRDTAEHVAATVGTRFDWCYADPDRRGPHGEKLVRLQDCSPDIISLMPRLLAIADNVCVKASPMFDIDEAFRLFGRCRVEVVSLDDECKEVLITVGRSDSAVASADSSAVVATALSAGSFSVTAEELAAFVPTAPASFRGGEYRWLVRPDVALQKARLVRRHLAGKADVWSENGYGFAVERPDGILGRVFEIESVERFDPKRLRRELKGVGVEIMRRDFPLTTQRLKQMTGIREGGDIRLAFTSVGGEVLVIRLK
ncbi:MAG: methyltransferase domain-containing protein [Alistipes sp.]|nr:methyltransferase domain-containing protein [Alistipes sp.]